MYVSITQELINATADPTRYKILLAKNITKLTLLKLKEKDSGKYKCSAVFDIKPTESQLVLKVLSFTEPLKPFVAIAAEVAVLVTLILLYERHSHRQKDPAGSTGRLKRHSDNSMTSIHGDQICPNKCVLLECFKLNTTVLSQLHREWTVWTYTVSISMSAYSFLNTCLTQY